MLLKTIQIVLMIICDFDTIHTLDRMWVGATRFAVMVDGSVSVVILDLLRSGCIPIPVSQTERSNSIIGQDLRIVSNGMELR